MPVHDWTRVNDATFHDFHASWVIHLKEALNAGLLPSAYYAQSEHEAGAVGRTAAIEETPSRVRRRVVVRHISGHQMIAVIEIASPAIKAHRCGVDDLVEQVADLLKAGIQVLLLDLLPPSHYDPQGLHGAIWPFFGANLASLETDPPLALTSYVCQGNRAEAYLEPVAVGQVLPDMPLFLNRERYVNVPLEPTYQAAYCGVPAIWRGVIEGA